MNERDRPSSGWAFVADNEGTAALLGTVIELDPDGTYTKSELADAAGVPMKRLYLSDALEGLVAVGLLSADDSEETAYTIDVDSSVYRTAAEFDEAVTAAGDGD